MQGLRTACKEAAWVFGLSRLFILICSLSIYLLPVLIPLFTQNTLWKVPYKGGSYTPTAYFFSWLRWDGGVYASLAFRGYRYPPDVAFFPLWPLLEHFAGLLLGAHFPISYYIGGLVLANLCFYFALVLLYCLLVKDFDRAIARRTMFYFAFSPYALFFFMGYSESLFVLLSIAVFLLLRRGNPLDWWLAGFLGFLATLTRSTGLLLAIPFLVVYAQRFWATSERKQHSWLQKLSALSPVALFPAGLLVYMIYLYYTKGNPFLFRIEEEAFWHRYFSLPWHTVSIAIETLFREPLIINLLGNLLDIICTFIPLGALALGWRRIPLHYSLFALGVAAFIFSFPGDTPQPLYSQPRFIMIIFPIALIFAIWGKRPRFHQCFMACSLALLMINIVLFVWGIWVA